MILAGLLPPVGNFFASLSLAVGIGFTASNEIGLWNSMLAIVQSVFSSNVVAVVFVISVILNLILPKDMEGKGN